MIKEIYDIFLSPKLKIFYANEYIRLTSKGKLLAFAPFGRNNTMLTLFLSKYLAILK